MHHHAYDAINITTASLQAYAAAYVAATPFATTSDVQSGLPGAVHTAQVPAQGLVTKAAITQLLRPFLQLQHPWQAPPHHQQQLQRCSCPLHRKHHPYLPHAAELQSCS